MRLSIITIARNNIDGLRRTITSVLNQTWRDFEYIIVDGASIDGSVELLEKFEQDNSKCADPISLKWISEPDKGIYNAMNKGTLMAKGEYCLYLNSGDILHHENTLSEVFSTVHTEDVFWGKMLFCYKNGEKKLSVVNTVNLSVFHAFDCRIPHQSCFIKRDLLQMEDMYDESYRIASDHKFLYKTVFVDKRKSASIDVIVSEMEDGGIGSNETFCNEEDDRLFCEFYSADLLKDYQEWRSFRRQNMELKSYIKSYNNAIGIYDYVKKRKLLKKIHTLLYRITLFLGKSA